MHDEATLIELRPHMRLLHGMRRPANWLQLIRFSIVGASGFAVNLASTRCGALSSASSTASPRSLAWIVAVVNNFVLNRHWTFNARDGQIHVQAMRFLAREPRRRSASTCRC